MGAFFVDRPVFAAVISIVIVVAGVCFFVLPTAVSRLPTLTPFRRPSVTPQRDQVSLHSECVGEHNPGSGLDADCRVKCHADSQAGVPKAASNVAAVFTGRIRSSSRCEFITSVPIGGPRPMSTPPYL